MQEAYSTKFIQITQRLVVGFLALLFSAQLYAHPGLVVLNSSADSTSGLYENQTEDLRVKIQGGYLRITRAYEKGQWQWNKRWNPIELYGMQDPDAYQTQLGTLDSGGGTGGLNTSVPANLPFAIVRNGSGYIWSVTPTDITHLAITDRTYIQGAKRIHVNEAGKSYTWSDRNGNTITYAGPVIDADDTDGYAPTMQIAAYSDKNGNTVTFNRNSLGDIETLSMAGNTLLTYHYNNGKLKSIEDYTGRKVEYYYTGDLLTGVRDVRGELWTYHYNDAQQLIGSTDPEGFNTTLELDANGILLSQSNDNGNKQDYSPSYSKAQDQYYSKQTDATGTVTERWANALGQTVRLDVNGETRYTVAVILSDNSTNVRSIKEDNFIRLGSPSSYSQFPSIRNIPAPEQQTLIYVKTRIRTDAQGDVTRMDYDQWGNIKKIIYPDGGIETRRYHPNYHLPTRITDETGVITEYSYDAKGNLTQRIEAKGLPEQRITNYKYNTSGNRIEAKVLANAMTEEAVAMYDYDDYGNTTRYTTAENTITQYLHYDALGNNKTTIDGRSKTWTKRYDNVGDMLSASDPENRTNRYEYDKAGKRTKTIAADGTETVLEYDGKRVVGLIEPAVKGTPTASSPKGYKTTLAYDEQGRLTKITDASGQRSNQTLYDKEGRLKQRIDGNNNTISYRYQDNQLSKITFPTFSEGYKYNVRDDIESITVYADGSLRQRTIDYDRDQRQNTTTDANSYKTVSHYDVLGRLIKTTDAEGGDTLYDYDSRDNLIKVTDPEGRSTRFEFDKNNRVIAEIKQANNERTEYRYDEMDNLTEIINANGGKTTFSYSDAGLLNQTQFYANQTDTTSEKTIDYSYNALGQLAGYDDGTSTQSYTYNAREQVTEITTDFGSFSKTINYSYYPNGQQKSLTNAEGIDYTYSYDNNGQLQIFVIPNEGTITVGDYNWYAPKTITYPGGGKRLMDYDGTLRLTHYSYQDPAQNQQDYASYGFGKEDNITHITNEKGDTQYDYDKLYRLTQRDNVATPEDNEQFSYDKVSNRLTSHKTTEDWVYNDNNQLIQADTITYAYDNNGNRISKADSKTNQTTLYTYNTEQRLIKVERKTNTATMTIAEYQYNPFGQRISKIVEGQTTYYLYGLSGLTAEYDQDGKLITEYQYSPESMWMTNPVLMRTSSNEILYYYNDHLGTPQALYTQQGQQKWAANYTSFGKATIVNNTVMQNLRFPGQYFDQETGLHYNYFRDYDPEIGRYVQTDPIGLGGGINRYGYVGGSPINVADPNGLDCSSSNSITTCIPTDSDSGFAPVTFPTPKGWDDFSDEGNPLRFHKYRFVHDLGSGCGDYGARLKDELVKSPTNDKNAASSDGTLNDVGPLVPGPWYFNSGVDNVKSYTTDQGVLNVTMQNHVVKSGFVTRKIEPNGHGGYQLVTYGEGNSLLQVMPGADDQADEFWGDNAELIKQRAQSCSCD